MTQDPMGDIPLFREIQKILSSSEGPINLEIARQVANALNQDTGDRVPPDEATAVGEAVHNIEFLVSGYSRLTTEEPARSDAISRRRWVETTLRGWEWLLKHMAGRFSAEVTAFASERGDEVNPMGAVMGQVAPLLLGIQAGTLVGQLARESLGRYDPSIPRDDDGHIFMVVPNLREVAGDYNLDVDDLRNWLVLGDLTKHSIAGSAPWVARYRRALFTEVIDSLEIDAGDLERRLAELQTQGIESLEEGLGSSDIIPIVETERHRRALDSLRAFTAVFEGYAEHVRRAVASKLGIDTNRIEESMRRRAASPSEGRATLRAMLGLSFDPNLEQSGATFCNAVVELRGIASLNTVWAAADNLPTVAEVRDPFTWIERVLDQ